MKKLISLLLVFIMLFSITVFASDEKITVIINNNEVVLGGDVIIQNDAPYIPMRAFCEYLGYSVKWDDEERCAVAVNSNNEIKIPVDEKWVKKNGLKNSMTNETIIIAGSTYMPIDALKGFEATYSFDKEKNTVNVEISLLDGKYYVIKHKATGKVMMPKDKETRDGTLIVLTDMDNSDAQIWQFLSRGSNVYRTINQKSLRSIDMPNRKSDEGLELIQYGNTEGTNQRVNLVDNGDGTFALVMNHSNMYLGATENLTVAQYSEFDKERDSFELVEITKEENAQTNEKAELPKEDAMTGKFVEVENRGVYKVILDGRGSYILENKETGKLLKKQGETDDFAAADVFTLNGDTLTSGDYSVKISDAKISVDNYTKDETGGRYYKLTNVASGKKVTVAMDSMDNGGKVISWTQTNKDSEIWAFVSMGNNKYVLINKNSNLAIDIPNHSKDAGIEVTQYSPNYGGNQIFEMIEDGGAVLFKNETSNLYLTAKNESITQENYVGNGTQKFTLEDMGESNQKMIGAAATLFLLKGEDAVTNVKLQWNEVGGATSYDIFKSVNGGEYEFFTNTSAITVDDYDLNVGDTVTYQIYALQNTNLIDYAKTEAVTAYELPADLESADNINPSGLNTPNKLKTKDGVYYKFEQWGREDGKGGFGRMMVRTSTDDITYSDAVEVMNINDILSHESCKGHEMCRFESVNYKYNPDTDTFAFIAHFEADGGYGTAKTSFATMKVGEKMIFHGAVRPNGDDTRDLNVFVDDDNTAYVMAAVHGNANLAIYRLKEDWSGVEKRVALINHNKWREFPNILKVDGIYYLFTSGCAGWYPTPSMYNSATSMEGPWSELRHVGNRTTFSAQSGGVYTLKEGGENYIMNPYRWMYYWKDAVTKSTQSRRFPIKVSNGYAFYDFYEELLYNWENDILVPVQRGKILSQEKPAGENGKFSLNDKANDGNYNTLWSTEKKWPYVWETDLGEMRNINQVQISWMIWNSSEAYYQYKIEGSCDGVTYETLVDKTDSYTDYGFTVDNTVGAARYIRLTAVNAKPRNSEENTYPSEFFEIKVIGE
ncbi:MAG: RICIN domain-containing protein [Clostridia bacterium]